MVSKIIIILLIIGCTSIKRECSQYAHKINYQIVDINQDAQISQTEFFEYMKHLFGALDKDSNNILTTNEIYPRSRCTQ